MALAILAFVGFSRMVMEIAQETGRTEFDHIIVYRDLRWLRLFVEGVFLFFLFDVMVAMLAGPGPCWSRSLVCAPSLGTP
jgi:uncharacterized membrane protein YkvI